MNKDVIYIDTEDDITAIIGRIKDCKEKIVAIVPPKRVGILQSAVNLRLLSRMADNSDKHLVLITNNKALIALAASAKIPVAKNLQSKPEFPEIAALEVDDDDDIIDGKQLPVGELVKTVDHSVDSDDDEEESDKDISTYHKPVHHFKKDTIEDDIEEIDIEGENELDPSKIPSTLVTPGARKPIIDEITDEPKKKVKIPNFSRFRKRLFFGSIAGIAFICFLVWAIGFAPAATVIITAKTTSAPVSMALKLNSDSTPTDVTKNTIQTITKTLKKDVSVDFTATGKKDVGEKAAGTITIRNCDYSEGFSLPIGTEFTNDDDQVYVSTAAVSVPGFSGSSSGCTLSGANSGKATVAVNASASGEGYNIAADSFSISAIPSGSKVDANGSAMTGGTTKMATVVTAEDIEKAKTALAELSNSTVKQQLTKQFTNGETVIADSFTAVSADPVSTPLIDTESTDGKAKLSSSTTFTIVAIAKSELQTYLKSAITKQMDNAKTQRIYDDGSSKITLSGYFKNDEGATVNVAATGKIGPNIVEDNIKTIVKGMGFGDVQSVLSGITGVSNVDVKFSYFWVTLIPNDIKKIDVEFKIQND